MKILIIGGVAGGATAAARLRRLNENDEIIVFEKDEYISFANCGLPYYIGDVISQRNNLLVQTVEGMHKRFNLDIRNFSEVTEVIPERKLVKVKNVKTQEEYEESFDKLIISTGANPIKPSIKGIEETENVFILRNVPDTDMIKAYVINNEIKEATVIGGGFIGIEMAENLHSLGVKVTIVEKANQVLAPLDFEMAQIIHKELNSKGVKLILGDGISSFENKGKKITLESGNSLETEMIILSIGVVPTNKLAKEKFDLGTRGHIITTDNFNVLENGKINDDIFAIGDVVEVVDFIDNSKTAVPLAWGANRQGRIVADYINGIDIKPSRIQGTAVAKVMDMVIATTGNNESRLKAKNMDYTAIHAHRGNHASYYPGASNIALKLIFDNKTKKILGAQAVGMSGTEKRIDVISTAMKLGATIYDLADLELCYAPPFSSAKDPVNILGYIAENVSDEVYKVVHWNEIDEVAKSGAYLLDVRTAGEYSAGCIEGSINIEVDSLRDNLHKLPKDKTTPIYVNCQVGLRAYIAIKILAGKGYTNLYNLSGGYSTYKIGKYKLKNDLK
ncbi:MAG: FAD-dependent oxidoreductase [Filifactoraceae bacterium]